MKRYSFVIIAIACGAVGFTSYRLGRERAIAAAPSAGFTASTATAPQGPETATESIPARPAAELASLKQRLKHSYATCPSAAHDWILRGQTAAVLGTMTAGEMESMLGELLAPLGGPMSTLAEWKAALANDLLREWGRKDPIAACSAMADKYHCKEGRISAFRDWLLRDPAAVARWMNSGDAVPGDLRKDWLAERVKIDPLGAIEQLAGVAPQQRESSLLEWSTACALLPAERKLLLEAVRDDPALLRKCAGRMAGPLADRSVEEAYEFVDGLELDVETTASLDDGIFSIWAMREPQVAFAVWAEQKETRVPDSFLRALDAWSLNSPGTEEAIQWVDTLEAGPAKEKIQVHFIEDLTGSERFEQAVRMGMSMANREEGKRQVLRVVTTWKEKFPGDARERLAVIFREMGVDVR